jgi:hypothetical protein
MLEIPEDGVISCPACSGEMLLVEYHGMHEDHYDGWSEVMCPKDLHGCGMRIGRWSEKVLQSGESEPRWGVRHA